MIKLPFNFFAKKNLSMLERRTVFFYIQLKI